MRNATGFTLIELLVTMVIIAIMVAVAAPRFMSGGDLDAPAYIQELAAAARYAQKLAVATGCPVRFQVTATTYTLQQPQNADCTGGFNRVAVHPATGGGFSGTAPGGLTVSGVATIDFDSRGVPNTGGAFGVAGRNVIVTAGSGYVEVQ